MRQEMRTVCFTGKHSKMLHVVAPGCIVNIRPGLFLPNGRQMTHVEVIPDGDHFVMGDVNIQVVEKKETYEARMKKESA